MSKNARIKELEGEVRRLRKYEPRDPGCLCVRPLLGARQVVDYCPKHGDRA